jgi:hypothetical protein
MVTQVLRDPRRYLLAVMAVALTVIVPLMFASITMIDSSLRTGSSIGWTVLWALLGVACVGLLVGVMVILARATRVSESEHETPDGGAHREL